MWTSLVTPGGIAVEHTRPLGPDPVVLLHAGIADRRMWDPLRPGLSRRGPVVRLDLRGFGDSTRAPQGRLDHLADLVATLDHLGVDRCHLVAASLGAGVAADFALTRPERALSLVLAPPGGSLLATMTADLRAFLDDEAAALADGDLEAATEANLRWWVCGPGRQPAHVDPALLDRVRDMQRRAFEVTRTWPGDHAEAELDPPTTDRLAELDTPTLVLTGGHDLAATHDAAIRLAGRAPQVRRVEWPDVAHLPSLERPDRFARLLRDWFDHGDATSGPSEQ